jgi:tRNA wybutosine-synthesizing protein 1
MPIPSTLLKIFRKQKYQLVGRHSAVKTCHWTKKSLLTEEKEHCYKQKFFNIRSLRCLQMTPSLGRCLQNCLFCWRATPADFGIEWDQTVFPESEADEPSFIVKRSVEAQRGALIGYKGNPEARKDLLELAFNPVHCAISLEGEATLYPRLGELIKEYFKHGFRTVFLVTNGMLPKVLSGLAHEPSQLYVSVCAPDEATYEKTCRPLVPDGWERLCETLELLHSVSCPTVIRMTLVRQLNLKRVEGYAKLALKASPTYLEPKAAMSVGFFLKRLPRDAMPTHSEIRSFAHELSRLTGYNMIDESEASRVVLLSSAEKSTKFA